MQADWQQVVLGDLVEITHGFAFKGEYFSDNPSGHVLLTPGNFAIGGGFRHDKMQYYGDGPVPEEFTLAPGELLITMTDLSRSADTLGYSAILPATEDRRYLHNQRLGRVLIKDRTPLDKRFLFYRLCVNDYRHEVLASATDTTVRHTAPSRIKAFAFSLPPLDEQRAIASILGALDDKTELNRRMNETLEAMARAIFQSWFVAFDPVIAKSEGRVPRYIRSDIAEKFPARFNDSELGRIPDGWRVCRFVDVTDKIGSGATPRGGSATYLDKGVALIRSQNVYDSEFRRGGLALIGEAAAQKLAGVTVLKDDVLLNITGASILRTCVVEPDVLPARVNQHVAIVRAKPGIPPRYLHQHLLREETKNYLLGMDAGGSREAVTKGHIESVPLILAPDSLLSRFRDITDPLFLLVENNTAQSRHLVRIRDILLPPLLSGKLRLGQAEKLVEEAV